MINKNITHKFIIKMQSLWKISPQQVEKGKKKKEVKIILNISKIHFN